VAQGAELEGTGRRPLVLTSQERKRQAQTETPTTGVERRAHDLRMIGDSGAGIGQGVAICRGGCVSSWLLSEYAG